MVRIWSALKEKWQKRAKQVENNKVRIHGKRLHWKYNPKKLNIPSVDCFHRKLSELILRIDWLWEHCKRNGNWFICSIQIRRLKLKCTSDFDDSIETISLTVDARKQKKKCDWITNSTETKKKQKINESRRAWLLAIESKSSIYTKRKGKFFDM